MLYRFIDDSGTFAVKDPQRYPLYLPLTDANGRLLSSISPQLAGDILGGELLVRAGDNFS